MQPLTQQRFCEQNCGQLAEVYAGGTGAGDWAGHYCQRCQQALGFAVLNRLSPDIVLPADATSNRTDAFEHELGKTITQIEDLVRAWNLLIPNEDFPVQAQQWDRVFSVSVDEAPAELSLIAENLRRFWAGRS